MHIKIEYWYIDFMFFRLFFLSEQNEKKNIRAVSKQIIWVTVPKGFSVASRPDTSGLFFANVISNYMSERDKYCVIHFYHRCTHSHAAAAVAFIN